jgi:hypothetical protein
MEVSLLPGVVVGSGFEVHRLDGSGHSVSPGFTFRWSLISPRTAPPRRSNGGYVRSFRRPVSTSYREFPTNNRPQSRWVRPFAAVSLGHNYPLFNGLEKSLVCGRLPEEFSQG